jgi:tRNA(adenine34) deaminase
MRSLTCYANYMPGMPKTRIHELIRECRVEAEKSINEGNPPFSCIITDTSGAIVVRDHNSQNTDSDPTAHAEIKALRQLGKRLGTRYLDDYVMFSNASSCSMCFSAGIKAHITEFYYGAPPESHMDP